MARTKTVIEAGRMYRRDIFGGIAAVVKVYESGAKTMVDFIFDGQLHTMTTAIFRMNFPSPGFKPDSSKLASCAWAQLVAIYNEDN